MKDIQKICPQCTNTFQARKADHNRGRARFCSKSCASKHAKCQNKPEPNVACAHCAKPIYRNPSKQKKSKSGLYFCCMKCKYYEQRIGGIPEIQPTHYGTGKSQYRKIAFEHFRPVCFGCGYNQHREVLQVHHVDENRANGDLNNLLILCPTCHSEVHKGFRMVAPRGIEPLHSLRQSDALPLS